MIDTMYVKGILNQLSKFLFSFSESSKEENVLHSSGVSCCCCCIGSYHIFLSEEVKFFTIQALLSGKLNILLQTSNNTEL